MAGEREMESKMQESPARCERLGRSAVYEPCTGHIGGTDFNIQHALAVSCTIFTFVVYWIVIPY